MPDNQNPPTPANDRGGTLCSQFQQSPHACKAAAAYRPVAGHGNNRLLTTEELASGLGLNAQSIRKRFSQTGSYFQLRPIKLPNRRLLWPADAIEQLISR